MILGLFIKRGGVANVQKENGYTMIANELLEEICRLPLTGYEFAILLFVVRRTYGFHKKTDHISIGQFQGNCGISRQSTINCLDRLVKANILVKSKNDYVCSYGIQKDYERWVVKADRLVKNGTKTSQIKHLKLVKPNVPTKETKETKERKLIKLKELKKDLLAKKII